MSKGYGDIVYIDLTNNTIERNECSSDLMKHTLGGRGLAMQLLYENLDKDVDPLSQDNILVFANGLFAGTEMICSSRLHICSKSPLSGYLCSSNGGGFSSDELSKCGILALVIKGKASSPVKLKILDKNISIEPADNLWGLSTEDTYERIQETDGKKTKIISIGQSGENLCGLSAVMTDIGHFAARTGAGAVMGSKNLKAISILANHPIRPGKRKEAIEAVKDYAGLLKASPFFDKYSKIGSTYLITWSDSKGAGSAYNYNSVMYDEIEKTAVASKEEIVVKSKACHKCPIHCKADIRMEEGRHKGKVFERPDFEPLVSFGAKCGNSDGTESVYLHNLCNDYGIDSIGAGNIIAFAINLFEDGVLTLEDTQGLELRWGDVEAIEKLLAQIVFRSSKLGDILAGGINNATKYIKGSQKYANSVKGLTMTAMDPRGFKATALGYAVSARGSDFTYVYAKPEYTITKETALKEYGTENAADRLSEDGKARMVRKCIINTAIIDAVGVCKITHKSLLNDIDISIISKLINTIGDFDFTKDDILRIGERIVNLERLLCYEFGSDSSEDMLPEKFIKEPIKEGLSKGSVVNLDKMIPEYYTLMGWNEDGSVSDEKKKELGL